MKLSILIPTLNEEKSIGPVIDEIRKAMDEADIDYEIAIVDGLSKDRTREIAREKGARVIEERRKGYGRAYKTGFTQAKGEVIATLDGDTTYPAKDILTYYRMLLDKDLDFITVDRFPHMEEGAMSNMHKIGNLALTFVTRLLFGRVIHDSQSGMWIFKKSALKQMDLTDDGMPLSEEIKIEAFRNRGLKSREVPMSVYRKRVGEVKLSSWRDGYRNITFLVKKRFRRRKGSLSRS